MRQTGASRLWRGSAEEHAALGEISEHARRPREDGIVELGATFRGALHERRFQASTAQQTPQDGRRDDADLEIAHLVLGAPIDEQLRLSSGRYAAVLDLAR